MNFPMHLAKNTLLASTVFASATLTSAQSAQSAQSQADAPGQQFSSFEAPMVSGDTDATSQGWSVRPLLTVGELKLTGATLEGALDVNETVLGYRVPGLFDGLGAYARPNQNLVRIIANHELTQGAGYEYTLANGTGLKGARLSFIDVSATSRRVAAAGLAYDTIFDRAGLAVIDGIQINEGNGDSDEGFNRFCSAYGVAAGERGFADNIYFAGEETSDGFTASNNGDGTFSGNVPSGFGGQLAAMDVINGDVYVVPMAGRAAFENVCPLDNGGSDKVVLAIGDDRQAAPIYIFIGEKGAVPAGALHNSPQFLIDNGLAFGQLYVFVADDNTRDPDSFNGTGSNLTGTFVRVTNYDVSLAGADIDGDMLPDFDAYGFAGIQALDAEAESLLAFRASRPEDVSPNPADPTQFVLAPTGRGGVFPSDDWGGLYVIDVDFETNDVLSQPLATIDNIPADITILYDGDDASNQDFGLRSPDNVDWSADGHIYAQEDRSTKLNTFGGDSLIDASVWQVDASSGSATRILEVDRKALPTAQADPNPFSLGQWETSGILDVTDFFVTVPGETLLLLDVQGHGVVGGGLALTANQSDDLVEGGQLVLASVIRN